MSQRKFSTFLASLVASLMLGMSNATDMAPPPPLFEKEVIEWLAPGGDSAEDGMVFVETDSESLGSAPSPDISDGTAARTSTRPIVQWFSRLFGLAG